jgi:hypothetical protein
LLHRDHFDEFFADRTASAFSFRAVDEAGEGIDGSSLTRISNLTMSPILVAVKLVIKRAVAASDRFELVIEVGDDLVERHAVGEEEPFVHRFGFF